MKAENINLWIPAKRSQDSENHYGKRLVWDEPFLRSNSAMPLTMVHWSVKLFSWTIMIRSRGEKTNPFTNRSVVNCYKILGTHTVTVISLLLEHPSDEGIIGNPASEWQVLIKAQSLRLSSRITGEGFEFREFCKSAKGQLHFYCNTA